MITIGCHLTASKGYEHMVKEALEIGANTFAFFTRNPRGGKSKDLDEEDVKRALELMDNQDSWLPFGKLVAHAPYTLNPCSDKEYVREFARMSMKEDLERLEYTPGNYYNFHPGSHVGQGSEAGIDMIAEILNEVMWEGQQTTVLLETMAGKGSEIGGSFDELAKIIDKVNLNGRGGSKSRIGVCLDTCHISDAGYDISGRDEEGTQVGSAKESLERTLEEFDKVIGLDYLKALHLNDSKNVLGAHKDRHEKIGEGFLRLDTFEAVVNHPVLKGLPMILETPNDLIGYAGEIELLRGLEK